MKAGAMSLKRDREVGTGAKGKHYERCFNWVA